MRTEKDPLTSDVISSAEIKNERNTKDIENIDTDAYKLSDFLFFNYAKILLYLYL